MALQLLNTRKDKNSLVNYIIYGESGIGKTSLVKQFPSEESLVLSAEDGLLCLGDHPVDYIDIISLEDVKSVIANPKFLRPEHKYVFIDSITELAQNHFLFLLAKYKVIAQSKGKDVSAYGQPMWGEFGNDFSIVFKELRRLNKTVIAFALEKEKENAIGQMVYMPDIYGKTAERIIAWFDECFRMFIVDGKRVFLTEKTEKSWAKDRSTKLDQVIPTDLMAIHKTIVE